MVWVFFRKTASSERKTEDLIHEGKYIDAAWVEIEPSFAIRSYTKPRVPAAIRETSAIQPRILFSLHDTGTLLRIECCCSLRQCLLLVTARTLVPGWDPMF